MKGRDSIRLRRGYGGRDTIGGGIAKMRSGSEKTLDPVQFLTEKRGTLLFYSSVMCGAG